MLQPTGVDLKFSYKAFDVFCKYLCYLVFLTKESAIYAHLARLYKILRLNTNTLEYEDVQKKYLDKHLHIVDHVKCSRDTAVCTWSFSVVLRVLCTTW